MKKRFLTLASLCALFLFSPAVGFAEGSAELGTSQQLQAATPLSVDILQAGEVISWQGRGRLTVSDPTGTQVATLNNGNDYTTTTSGEFGLELNRLQDNAWDVEVTNSGTVQDGRLFSRQWQIDAQSFSNTTDASFFAVVPAGSSSDTAVVEIDFEGLAGYEFSIIANSQGVDGADARSVPVSGNTISIEYPMYLNPPARASYSVVSPTLTNFGFDGGQSCNQVIPSVSTGDFEFDTNVEGNYRITCDLNDDGIFDYTSDDDVTLVGTATPGTNTATWSGVDNTGAAVPEGIYDCRILVTVGEFHYVGVDIETSYPGFRLFSLDSSLTATGLDMYWNDEAIQSGAIPMPNFDTSAESSGLSGVNSGDPSDPVDPHGQSNPNGNARAWGNFLSNSKGNETYVDTYTFLASAQSTAIQVETTDGTDNSDTDALTDYEEACVVGSNPAVNDTDGDGINDDVEVTVDGGSPNNPTDTDGDGVPNVLDDDDDGDGIPTSSEDTDGDGDPTNDDSDGDGIPDYLDICGDGVASIPENEECDDGNAVNGDGCTDACIVEPGYDCPAAGPCTDIDECAQGTDNCDANATCTNEPGTFTCACDFGYTGDGVTCSRTDQDGDGTDDVVECTTPGACEDTDGDGTPDYLDICGDGRLSTPSNEACDDGNEVNGDGCSDTCTIEPGFECPTAGSCTDIDECAMGTDNCDTNATCTNEPGSFSCSCDFGYEGDGVTCSRADTDGDGTDDLVECTDPQACEDTDGDGTPDYQDVCGDGRASIPANEACDDGNAVNGDGCSDTCVIESGWECPDAGACTDIDECAEGTDNCDVNATCTNEPGSFTCTCNFGFAGDGVTCDPSGDSDGDGITDLDECSDPNNCEDTDGDGLPDYADLDSDNDGLLDSSECEDPSACSDLDGDGIADFRDRDSDGDGLSDAAEAFDADDDGDGVYDGFEDTDNDGADDGLVNSSVDPIDTDGESTPDHLQADADNDGISDAIEGHDADGDGVADTDPAGADSDSDGIDDAFDPDCATASDCGGVIGTPAARPDADGDGVEDFRDLDSDADGIGDDAECGTGATCVDTDGDSTPDYLDDDSDGDGVLDAVEGHDEDSDGTPDTDPSGLDADGDGLDDAYDQDAGGTTAPLPNTDGSGAPDFQDDDDDGDDIPTATEESDGEVHGRDVDGDGIPNYLDPDSDGDGASDSTEFGFDIDEDGVPDYLDPDASPIDTDEDGIADTVECGGNPADGCPDTDGDGNPDYDDSDDDGDGIETTTELEGDDSQDNDADGDGRSSHLDVDSDGDGITDGVECDDTPCPDTDEDGVPDYLDEDSDDDGAPDSEEGHEGTTASGSDSDADGLDDAYDPDSGGVTAALPDSDADGIPDFRDPDDNSLEDSDGDGLTDGEEDEIGTDPQNPDTDGDGLQDGEEVDDYETDPLVPDTDAGGVNDGDEVTNGTDPLDPTDDFDEDSRTLVVKGGACTAAPGQSGGTTLAWVFGALLALALRRRRQ